MHFVFLAPFVGVHFLTAWLLGDHILEVNSLVRARRLEHVPVSNKVISILEFCLVPWAIGLSSTTVLQFPPSFLKPIF